LSRRSAEGAKAGRAPTRSVGATAILVNGAAAAYLARGDRVLVTFLPDTEPDRSKTARAVARVLIERARSGAEAPRGMLIEEIDGVTPEQHPLAPFLIEAGFIRGALGLQATLRSHQPSVRGYPAEGGRQPASGRRPSTSLVSSPFSSRYFEPDAPDES
jgi:hypothetical protein